jgi:hypothetical protein
MCCCPTAAAIHQHTLEEPAQHSEADRQAVSTTPCIIKGEYSYQAHIGSQMLYLQSH